VAHPRRRGGSLIDDFYRALAAGKTVGDAARTAKLAAIARGASPATWAAFSVIGDANVTVPLTVPGPEPMSIIRMVAVVAAAACAYWVVRRTRRWPT
jgi:hypothetical protein